MLLNSYAFIFIMLPISILGVWSLSNKSLQHRQVFLTLISLIFYSFWGFAYFIVLISSVAANYFGSRFIMAGVGRNRFNRLLVMCGLNIAVLIYFKYAPIIFSKSEFDFSALDIGLPLAISFFTFQQLSYLIDASRAPLATMRLSWVEYALMVVFFPHLLAGPIVRYTEIIPQFRDDSLLRVTQSNLAIGLSVFVLGLAKKVLIGDNLAHVPDSVFVAAASGQLPTLGAAWFGSVSYTLQLYFDFSGYSDMAIGLARIFGIRLPINFDSPYKARGLVEIWKNWHMTMTRFFMDYVYSPWVLREMRSGMTKRWDAATVFLRALALPTISTFILVGLWHGSGANFLVFGVLHGIALTAVRLWRDMRLPKVPAILGWFLAVSFFSITLVLIRAPDLSTASIVFAALLGKAGNFAPITDTVEQAAFMIGLVVCLVMPNVQEIFRKYSPMLGTIEPRSLGPLVRLAWQPSTIWAIAIACLLAGSILNLFALRPFIYLQF